MSDLMKKMQYLVLVSKPASMNNGQIISIAIGEKHFLAQSTDSLQGARCTFAPKLSIPLCLAAWVPDPSPKELRPKTVHLGLLAYHRAISQHDCGYDRDRYTV